MKNRLSRWLERLEDADRESAGIDPDEYARNHAAARLAEAEALFACIPESRRQAVLARVIPGQTYGTKYGKGQLLAPHPVDFDSPGLRMFLSLVESKTWAPSPLPETLVDALLRWPCLRHEMHCGGCRLPLPYGSGDWISPKGVEWQAFMLPFTECPACGTSIRESAKWDWIKHWLPPFVPATGWTFRCNDPECPHGEMSGPTVPARTTGAADSGDELN